jgi:hypothetical protein
MLNRRVGRTADDAAPHVLLIPPKHTSQLGGCVKSNKNHIEITHVLISTPCRNHHLELTGVMSQIQRILTKFILFTNMARRSKP